jgi:hypothetical protein
MKANQLAQGDLLKMRQLKALLSRLIQGLFAFVYALLKFQAY